MDPNQVNMPVANVDDSPVQNNDAGSSTVAPSVSGQESPKKETVIATTITLVQSIVPQPVVFPNLDTWPIIAMPTARDENNFYHAILQAFYTPYLTGVRDGQIMTKAECAAAVKDLLFNNLWEPYSGADPKGPKNYDLVDGQLQGLDYERLNLELNKRIAIPFLGNRLIDEKYLWYITKELGVNIFILDTVSGLCYRSEQVDVEGRRSICIVFRDGFFDTVALMLDNSSNSTFFAQKTGFARALAQLPTVHYV